LGSLVRARAAAHRARLHPARRVVRRDRLSQRQADQTLRGPRTTDGRRELTLTAPVCCTRVQLGIWNLELGIKNRSAATVSGRTDLSNVAHAFQIPHSSLPDARTSVTAS